VQNAHRQGAGEGSDLWTGYGTALGSFIYERGNPHCLLKAPKVSLCRSGTGDVSASILIAGTVNGAAFPDSVEKAARFISHALERTTELESPAPTAFLSRRCWERVPAE